MPYFWKAFYQNENKKKKIMVARNVIDYCQKNIPQCLLVSYF